MSYSSLAQLVQHFESGGDYTAQNKTTTASGAYQFINSTWQQYAGQIGYGQYQTAASAPPAVQDAVFAQAVQQRGLADWTCPGCNPALSAYLQANPTASGLPVNATSNPLGGGYLAPDGSYVPPQAIPGVTPNPGQTPMAGTTTGATSVAGGWLSGVWTIAARIGVFGLGSMLVILALAALLWESKTVQVAVKAAEA